MLRSQHNAHPLGSVKTQQVEETEEHSPHTHLSFPELSASGKIHGGTVRNKLRWIFRVLGDQDHQRPLTNALHDCYRVPPPPAPSNPRAPSRRGHPATSCADPHLGGSFPGGGGRGHEGSRPGGTALGASPSAPSPLPLRRVSLHPQSRPAMAHAQGLQVRIESPLLSLPAEPADRQAPLPSRNPPAYSTAR